MAANNEGTIITMRGLQLITKLVAGTGQIEFTTVKVGTGVSPPDADPSSFTHLVAYKMDGMIAGYGYDEEARDAYVIMQITNEGIESGFVMTEVGLYANDPDLGEILYAYVDLSNDPNHIAPTDSGRSKTVQIKLHVIVGEVTEITATINPLSQITRSELDKALNDLEARVGHVRIGQKDTILCSMDTLFVVDTPEARFGGAAYSNMVFSREIPHNAENWAQLPGVDDYAVRKGDAGIIDGKLAVSEGQPDDAVFFARIIKE